MSIKVNSVFRTSNKDMNPITKLLYVYLITHPQLTVVGVVQIIPAVTSIEIGITVDQLREASKELVDKNFIKVMSHENNIYYFIYKHYDTNTKGEDTIRRAYNTLKQLPKKVVEWTGISIDSRRVMFNEPTVENITNYAMSLGYAVDGEVVIEFYRKHASLHNKLGWVDSRGKQVIDWKAKIKKVWCKEQSKVQPRTDAPTGYEHFYVKYGDRIVTPDYWKNELPYSMEGIVVTEELKQAYEKHRNSV